MTAEEKSTLKKRETEIRDEMEEDLRKDLKHLLLDVYEELVGTTRPVEESQRHAQKRLSALQVKIALGSDRLQKEIRIIAYVSAGIALISLFVALLK